MAGPMGFIELVAKGHADPGTEPQTKAVDNVFHFRRTVLGGTPSKAQFVTAWTAAIRPLIFAALSVHYTLDELWVRFVDDALDQYDVTTVALPGSVPGDALPSLNNVTLQLRTLVRGRNYKGSKHFGPIAENDTTLDKLQAGAITSFTNLANGMLAGFTDAGGWVWKPVVLSRKKSQLIVNPTLVVATDVSSIRLNQILGQMKRRKQRS